MTQQHPITPPPELVQEWFSEAKHDPCGWANWVATQAAQWGADQELEACCEWLEDNAPAEQLIGHTWVDCEDPQETAKHLRAARRPKPPSLAEQGLKLLEPPNGPVMLGTPEYRLTEFQAQILRAALDRLAKLEAQQ